MNSYIVINASAGSGKTYSLVKNILKICLKSSNPEIIGNILAVTFTNKAAGEMKERILLWLEKFSLNNYAKNPELILIQNDLKEERVDISIEELHQRAKRLFYYVLHNYSVMSLCTIDSFNSKLIRSFAYELGFSQNFELSIDPNPIVTKAIDKTLEKIGEDRQISEAFMDYVLYSLYNEDKKLNLSKTLFENAKKFNNDVHYFALKKNKDFDWISYKNERDRLRNEIDQLKENSEKIAIHSIDLIKSRNLEIDDFSGGKSNSIAVFFKKYLDKSKPMLPDSEEKALEKFEKLNSSKAKNRSEDISEILSEFLENRRKIIYNYINIEKNKKIHKNLLPLRINKEIQEQIKRIQKEDEILILSEFNTLIYEFIRNQSPMFINEKIGENYQHYFFDEFQDTSFLQWENFIPIRDSIFSQKNTSFTIVGDPKQSIYSFRGGDAKLMLDIINKKETSPQYADIQNLEHNFRSSKNIVIFNNLLYKYISESLNEDYKDIFGKYSQQKPKSENSGRVKIHLLENENTEMFFDDVSEKMVEDITESINNGFSFSDIAILCRKKSEIIKFSQLLSKTQVNYLGEKTFIKTISDDGLSLNLSSCVNAIIEYISWIAFPKNEKHLAMCLYYLDQYERIKINDFAAEITEILQYKNIEIIIKNIENKYGIKFPLYANSINNFNFIENVLQEFCIEGRETDYLLNFLELAYDFYQNSKLSLNNFIDFWKEIGCNSSIQTSENTDSIRLMTIHKSKGLEFPIVFIPIKNSRIDTKDEEFSDWYKISNSINNSLKSVNISNFKKEFEFYDSEIQEFNEKNSYKNKIDRLCTQYVATTRPVEQMFLYIQKPKKTNYQEIYDFIMLNNVSSENSFDFFSINEKDLLKQNKKKDENIIENVKLTSIKNVSQKKNKIYTKNNKNDESIQNQNRRLGILTHEILEKIVTKEDASNVLKYYILNGKISKNESDKIENKLTKLFKNHSEYFSGKYEILNERDILFNINNENKLIRVDRIMKSPNGWIILDFKTGIEREEHKSQVEMYKIALENSGEKVWKTEILYI